MDLCANVEARESLSLLTMPPFHLTSLCETEGCMIYIPDSENRLRTGMDVCESRKSHGTSQAPGPRPYFSPPVNDRRATIINGRMDGSKSTREYMSEDRTSKQITRNKGPRQGRREYVQPLHLPRRH